MSYELHVDGKFVKDIGSATRYNNLVSDTLFCEMFPKLCAFLNTSVTANPKGVVEDINAAIQEGANEKVSALLVELRDGLKKAKKSAEIVG